MTTYDVAAVFVVGGVTVLTRALPFLLFGKKEKLPSAITFLGEYLPGALMILLVLYCLRDEILHLSLSPRIVVGVGIFFFQLLFKNTFLSMFVGTLCYVLLHNHIIL